MSKIALDSVALSMHVKDVGPTRYLPRTVNNLLHNASLATLPVEVNNSTGIFLPINGYALRYNVPHTTTSLFVRLREGLPIDRSALCRTTISTQKAIGVLISSKDDGSLNVGDGPL